MALNPFEQALVDEGIAGTPLEPLARSIYRQESSSGRNTQTSNAGAVGGMQILPGTFNEVMPGGNINDPYQNSVAGLRYIKKMNALAGGDPSLTAAGYYGGPGGLEKAKQGIAVSDPRNPNAPTTLQYAQQVTGKVSRETLKPEDVIQDAGRGYQAAYALMSLDDEDEAKYKERQEQEASDKEDAERFNTAKQMLANVKVKSVLQPVERAQGSPEEGEVAQNNQSSGGYERWLAEKIGVDQAWDKAMKAPSTMGYSGDSGTAGDAVRHMTLMREIGKKYGETPARMIGWAHEYIGGPMQYFSSGEPQSSRDREMDIHNNALGLELSRKARDDAHFNELVRDALKNRQADYYREEYNDRTMPVSGGGTGFTGETRKMLKAMPKPGVRKRAGGSPEEGEVAAEPSLKETAATMWASLKNPEHWKELGAGAKRAAVATPGVVESVGRGAIATVPGTVGDVESLVRLATGGKQVMPTTEDILKATDKYRMFSKPEGASDLEMVGGWISPAGAPASAMLVKGAEKAIKPTAKAALKAVNPPRHMGINEIEPAVRQELREAKTGPTPVVRDNRLLPTNEYPYVGELERIVSDLPGATTVQQIKGMIAKTGRNYEIDRLEKALEGLGPKDKLSSAELLRRLDEISSPASYRVQIIEPDHSIPGKFYQNMDNPRPSQSLGVINLLQDRPVAQRMESAFYEEKLRQLTSLKSTLPKSEEKEAALRALEVYFRGPDTAGTVMGETFKTALPEIKSAVKEMHDATNFYDRFRYINYGEKIPGVPTLSESAFDIARTKYGKPYHELSLYEQQLIKPEAEALVKQKVVEMADKRYGTNLQQEFNSPAIQALEPKAKKEEMERIFKEQMQMQALGANRQYEELMGPYADLLKQKSAEKTTYKGQHPSLGKDNPIAFSRFLDVDLPGNKKGMFVAELQSDRYDDLVVKGAKSGSSAKDMKEISNLHDVLSSRKSQIDELQYLVDKGEDVAKNEIKLKQAQIEQARDEKRMANLGGRIRGGGRYSIEEAFPGMEKNPQVVQQLMIKNAVIGGIQRGKDAVLFPGADSAQKQLYEKLPNNIKAVLKDLGPGFKMETIPMKSENGDIINRVSITWDEKAAQRLQREGVRFAKGGFVEKKY